MKCENVLDIIIKYLEDNEYDGLEYDGWDGDYCSCSMDDICPCGELSLECKPKRKE